MSIIESLEIDPNDNVEAFLSSSLSNWKVDKCGEKVVLFSAIDKADNSLSALVCTSEVLSSVLRGLIASKFTGRVSVKYLADEKTLYFNKGELVFAKSNLIDDRLGEVIYREGKITLEQMTSAAIAVTRERKFGKVLIESGEYTSVDLWQFLIMQVEEIFQSVFLVDELTVCIEHNKNPPPATIAMSLGTSELLDESSSFGMMFKSFLGHVNDNSVIQLIDDDIVFERASGTHLVDFLSMIKQAGTVGELLALSKLTSTNTMLALFKLVVRRFVEVREVDQGLAVELPAIVDLRGLKASIDAYSIALSASKKAFANCSSEFPMLELNGFVTRMYGTKRLPLFLKKDGSLAKESVRHLLHKSRASEAQHAITCKAIDSLTNFVLQITGDLLPQNGWGVKKSIQEIIL